MEPARNVYDEETEEPKKFGVIEGNGEGDGNPQGELRPISIPHDSVYDIDDKNPVTRPNLKALEGAGAGDGVASAKLKSLNNSEIKDKESSGISGSDETSDEEKAKLGIAKPSDIVGKGVNPADFVTPTGRLKLIGRLLKRRRNRAVGAAGLGLIGIIVMLFFLIIPLKIEHIVQNLEKRFFSSSRSAVEDETERLTKNYIVKKVLPAYKSCGTTIDRKCSVQKSPLTNPVSRLYNTYADNRIETKLAEKRGIEFKYDQAAGKWYMKTPSNGKGVDIGKNGENIDNGFRGASRGEIRRAVRDETQWYQVMVRYQAGRLVEKKYGVKRCIVFCGTKDKIADKKDTAKLTSKLVLTQRVLLPREQVLGVAIECLLTGCNPTDTQPNGDPNSTGENGAPKDPAVDKKASDGVRELANSYGVFDEASIKAIQEAYDGMSKEGIQKYLLNKGLTKIGVNEATSEIAGKSIPVIGWINLAAKIISTGDNAGPAIKKLRYVTNAYAAVQLFYVYRSYADEIHTGNVNAAEAGSMVDSLGTGFSNSPNDPKIGGDATAEESPLYGDLLSSSGQGSTLGSIFSPSAFAAGDTANSAKYICNNGKPVPTGKKVCNEEVLGGGNSIADGIHDFLNAPGVGIITTIAKAWTSTVGAATDLFVNIFSGPISAASAVADATCNIPFVSNANPYCIAKDAIDKAIPFITEGITKWLIPNPFGTNMSGGRTFNMMAAGADVAGNDFAHNGIGGRALTNQEVAEIRSDEQQKENEDIASASFMSRMFNTQTDSSLISQVALATPSNLKNELGTYTATSVSSYLSGFASIFGAITSPRAYAAQTASPDPFGVTQYGYTKADLDKIGDAETYWDNNCTDDPTTGYQKDNSYNIEASKTLDDQTATPKNTSTNPCALIMKSVGAAGAKYDTSLLSEDEQKIGDTTATQTQTTNNDNVAPPDSLNGRTLSDTEKANLKYIKDNVLSLLDGDSDKQATVAAQSAWWSIREAVLDIKQPDVFGYSNCGDTPSGVHHIGLTDNCSGSTWQVGIGAPQVPFFSDTQVESTAKSLHPGQNIRDILKSVALLSGEQEGSAKYNAVLASTGPLRRSLVMRDPATGITLVNPVVANGCLKASPEKWCITPGDPISTDRKAIGDAIATLKDYFLSNGPTAGQGQVSGSAQDLAKQILSDSNITLQGNPRLSIEAASKGEKSPGGVDSSGVSHPPVMLQANLLSMLVSLSKSGFKFTITSLTTGAHAPTSDHYKGEAVDIGVVNGVTSTGRSPEDIKLIKQILQDKLMPQGSQIGQVGCPSGSINTPGYEQVADTCNHLHLGLKGG